MPSNKNTYKGNDKSTHIQHGEKSKTARKANSKNEPTPPPARDVSRYQDKSKK